MQKNIHIKVNDRLNKYKVDYLDNLKDEFIKENGIDVYKEYGSNIRIVEDQIFLKNIFHWVGENIGVEFLDKLIITKDGINPMHRLFDDCVDRKRFYSGGGHSFSELLHFTKKIIKLYKPENIINLTLDPLDIFFLEKYKNFFGHTYINDYGKRKIEPYFKLLDRPSRVNISPFSSSLKKKHKEKFDMVFFNLSLYDINYRINRDSRRRFFEYSINILKPKGQIVAFIETKYLSRSPAFMELLSNNKIYISSVFEIYNSKQSIIILSRIKVENIFNAKISQSDFLLSMTIQENEANNIVFKNFMDGKKGDLPEFGRLLSIEDKFKGIDYLKWIEDCDSKFSGTKIKKALFEKFINKINRKERNDNDHWKKKENSIYIYITDGRFFLDPKNEPTRNEYGEDYFGVPSNFYQIELNDKCHPEYAYSYFKSDFGLKSIRANRPFDSDFFIKDVEEIPVFFPPLDFQKVIINKTIEIKNLILKSNNMNKMLFDFDIYKDNNFKKISLELEKFNSLESWYKTLPFPLSSILYRYETFNDHEEKEKVDTLIDFFRAYAIFFSVIIVSSMRHNDKLFYDSVKNNLFEKHDEKWIMKPDFGKWYHLLKNIVTLFNKQLNGKENEKEKLYSMLGNPSNTFVEMVTNKKIVDIIDTTSGYKNRWRSHGGIVNRERQKERLNDLKKKLNQFRSLINNSFDDVNLFIAGAGEFDGETNKHQIKLLKGFTNPLKSGTTKSINNLINGKLYLTHGDSLNPIYILDVMKYTEEKNAFYFINEIKIGNKKVHYVSYNYEDDNEQEIGDLTEKFRQMVYSFVKE